MYGRSNGAKSILFKFPSIKAGLIFVPTFIWNVLLGRWLKIRNWWDRIDETMIVGALPLAKDVANLAGEGVRSVVNTCAEYEGPQEEYEKYGIVQMHMPTIDFTHPSLSDVQAAVRFIDEHVQDGSTVYVHCKAGRARSATIAMCWLIKNKGMTPKQAQALLMEKRPHINKYIFKRPVVKAFCKSLPENDQPAGSGQSG